MWFVSSVCNEVAFEVSEREQSAPPTFSFGLFLFGEGLGVWFVSSVCNEVAFEVSEREQQSGDLAGVGVGDGGRAEDDDADVLSSM